MDVLQNKRYEQYDYTSRYTTVPYYYNTLDSKDIYGLGTNVYKTTAWAAHKLEQADTLDSLALRYYGNPTLWWAIAYFNDIQDAFEPLMNRFEIIKIPAITGVSFGLER